MHEYTAGLFDGEGSVTLAATGGRRRRKTRQPFVSITSTTRELVDYLFQTYGGSVCIQRKKKKNHSQAWIWKLKCYAAIDFLKLIRPHIREPEKIRRADLLIECYHLIIKRHGCYTPEERETKIRFYEEFFKNSRCRERPVATV